MSKTSGRFEPIEFFENTITTNTTGNRTAVPVSYWATRATVKPLSESRGLEAYQVILRAGFEFSMRYRSDKTVTKGMKLVYSGKTLVIHSIVNVNEQNKEVRVIAMVNE
jgi:SPP1 family predicted phage head-tail adaptor